MWLERKEKKAEFIRALLNLDSQVLFVRGARQVGKTSFILNALKDLEGYPQLKLNLAYPGTFTIGEVEYLGRDFFGKSPEGEEFLKNIQLEMGNIANLEKPALIFVDEVDRHPQAMESIQTLATFSEKLKFVFTGSNLENMSITNAATGRKKFLDLYPITFKEFLQAQGSSKYLNYINQLSFKNEAHSAFYHNRLNELLELYIRIGGMPKIVDTYLDSGPDSQGIPEIIKDLAFSMEENVKTVLGEKSRLYEYEDVLRKMAHLSINTLKYSNLQVQHAGRGEAKKLVAKTTGARVTHKIRLYEAERDLSKYILFDCGIANYLLCGSDLLKNKLGERYLGILYETFVGTELIAGLHTRDDLFYWKSGNKAEVDFLLRSPYLTGIDVKSGKGKAKSLNSLALFEPDASFIVKISHEPPSIIHNYTASLPNHAKKRKTTLVNIPHYLTFRLMELLEKTMVAIGK